MDINVRSYEDKDFLEVKRIVEDNFGDTFNMNDIPDYIYPYVAEIDGKVVGFYILSKIKNIVRDKYMYLIDYVCCDKEYQGRGIGKSMMRHAIDICKEEKPRYLQLTCSNKRTCALGMYESVGFTKYETNVYRMEF